MAAKRRGVELAPPVLIPAGLGLLGERGLVRLLCLLPDRVCFPHLQLNSWSC